MFDFLTSWFPDHLVKCQLLGDRFGYSVQFLLAFCSFSTLVVKRLTERPQRTWTTWWRDASKQCIGSLAGHAWNLVYALALESKDNDNPCVFYFVQYLLADNLLGIFLNWLVMGGVDKLAHHYRITKLESGHYGTGDHQQAFRIWLLQLGVWIGVISVVKAFLFITFLLPFRDPLYSVGQHVLGPLKGYPRVELIVVMVLVPLFVNILQFWIQDNFLMLRPGHKRHHLPNADGLKKSSYGSIDAIENSADQDREHGHSDDAVSMMPPPPGAVRTVSDDERAALLS